MTELVLAVNRTNLENSQIGTDGLYNIDLLNLDQKDYAFLPRSFADNKSEKAIQLGKLFPQILGYVQLKNPEGKYLAYQRKGKEEGLLGKWSIGIGGHISDEDLQATSNLIWESYPGLVDLILLGTRRELEEETGLVFPLTYTYIAQNMNKILSSYSDVTSTVHVGLPLSLTLSSDQVEAMKLEPSEFNNWKWMSEEELKEEVVGFETWSAILINNL